MKIRLRARCLDARFDLAGLPATVLASVLFVLAPGAVFPGQWDAKRFKDELRSIQDGLAAGEWSDAERDASELIAQGLEQGLHDVGSRPIYGLAYAFRAISEQARGNAKRARWDWSVAAALSPAAVSFDLNRFGEPGRALRDSTLDVCKADLEEGAEPLDSGIKAGFRPPVKVSARSPEYPEALRLARENRVIDFELVVDRSGFPGCPRWESDLVFDLWTAFFVAAFEALRDWRFEPATLSGEPVSVWYRLSVEFHLE